MKLAILNPRITDAIKRMLPTSLFGRALLILIIPTVLLQVLATYIFFERHWDNVTRHMSASLAGEVALLVHEIHNSSDIRRHEIFDLARDLMGIRIALDTEKRSLAGLAPHAKPFPEFQRQLQKRLAMPFTVSRQTEDADIDIAILLPDGVLTLEVSKKRLVSSTTGIFIMWMVGASLVLMLIATLFLRNQIRPITKLSQAAEKFGKGEDIPDFRPAGAMEVRRAGRAFLVMRERIRRQIATRTEMLAGISHDLRTPLTRMKLGLAMLGEGEEISNLSSDVRDMEHMIDEYLQFARGEGREETSAVTLSSLLGDVVQSYKRQGKTIPLTMGADEDIALRLQAMKRCLGNVIDNAFRYAGQCHISTQRMGAFFEIIIDDDGPGIPEADRAQVFQPFRRLDPSRNLDNGGVGLGLTIARDVMASHGGKIALGDSPLGGLRVTLMLPR